MTVKSVNGKQGYINLETSDIPESIDLYYLTLEERQEIIKLGIQLVEIRAHTYDNAIHVSKELTGQIKSNVDHTRNSDVHIDDGLRKKIEELRKRPGRRGLPGKQGLPGPAGSDGGGTNFIDLSDTPLAYAGEATKLLQVNAAEDAVEFTANPAAPASGAFGYWTRDSVTGVVTLVTATDNLSIKETILTKRVLAGGVT